MSIPATPTTGALGKLMAMVFTLCAAREDATTDQLERLRTTLVPVLRGPFRKTGDTSLVLAVLYDVMGHTWHPAGQWAQAIEDPLGPVASGALKRGIDPTKLFD